MIAPEDVARAAKKFEDENYRFRIWLKNNAEPDELDARFRELHEKLFADYDCRQCANCCREYTTLLQPGERSALANRLGISESEFLQEHTEFDNSEGVRVMKTPCPMLLPDGSCMAQDCKPQECRDFPYTNKPDRISSLYSVLSNARVCPVVFEILQQLKQMYGFGRRGRRRW